MLQGSFKAAAFGVEMAKDFVSLPLLTSRHSGNVMAVTHAAAWGSGGSALKHPNKPPVKGHSEMATHSVGVGGID
jgi:hypothetical protein